MGVVDDEVFYFLTILFVVLTLVLVIDFGLDIDERVPPIALALSAMALGVTSVSILTATTLSSSG